MSKKPTYAQALAAQKARRKANETRVRRRNEDLPAGSPMYFDCKGCGAEIEVPEDYIYRRDYCADCESLLGLPPKPL